MKLMGFVLLTKTLHCLGMKLYMNTTQHMYT